MSSDHLRNSLNAVAVLHELTGRYDAAPSDLSRALAVARASRRRDCGKHLMSAGRALETRRHFVESLTECDAPSSLASL
jgi:hypothetical protein